MPDTEDGVELLYVQRAHELPGGKDHFGFFDGVSQPAIQGSGVLSRPGDGIRRGRATGGARSRPGEVLLGYPDEDRTLPKAPHAPYDRNGTYVVLRKLRVDTAAFRRFVAEADYPGGPELLAAKIVGRWPDGTPLALAPDGPDAGTGERPVADQRLRLRGRPPGPALSAGLAHPSRQPARRSELLRRTAQRPAPHRPPRPGVRRPSPARRDWTTTGPTAAWCSSASSRTSGASSRPSRRSGSTTGTASVSAATPTLSSASHTRGRTKLTVPGTPPYFVTARPRLVTMRGGAYLFQPSMTALRHLAGLAVGFRPSLHRMQGSRSAGDRRAASRSNSRRGRARRTR